MSYCRACDISFDSEIRYQRHLAERHPQWYKPQWVPVFGGFEMLIYFYEGQQYCRYLCTYCSCFNSALFKDREKLKEWTRKHRTECTTRRIK